MRNLLALLLFVPSLCLAQLPDYTPSEGLVAFYPLESNANDAGPNGMNGTLEGVTFDVIDGHTCAHFDGTSKIDLSDFNEQLCIQQGYSLSYSFYCTNGQNQRPILTRTRLNDATTEYFFGVNNGHVTVAMNNDCGPECNWGSTPETVVTNYVWNSCCLVWEADTIKVFFNGACVQSMPVLLANDAVLLCNSNQTVHIGHNVIYNTFWSGGIKELGIWDRPLSEIEILGLHLTSLPEFGCTNTEACNFQPDANLDDGSCISCEVLASACGEGTVWDSTLQQCISIAPPCAPSCGEGTVWDPVNEECIIAIPADLNYDGCVSVNDLLILLAVHGTCPPYPEWPDEPTDTTWTCGDPVTYWDYDYATVLIGDQCWFAENLRPDQYTNGDPIPSNFSGNDWQWLNTGATSTYGENGSCNHESPIIDACDPSESLATHGRLYNWYVVDDVRGICPMDWHVPDNEEWDTLISVMGGVQLAVTSLKSPTGWANGENGSNSSGFNGKPGGQRDVPGGAFEKAGARGRWWSTSNFSVYGWTRGFSENSNEVESYAPNMKDGFSIRCIKD